MVVYQEGPSAGPRHLWAYVYNGTSVVTGDNITNLENVNTSLDHVFPHADSDGVGYVVGDSEFYGPGDYDIYVSQFCVGAGNVLRVGEDHRNLDFDTVTDSQARLTAAHSGGGTGRNFMVTWAELSSGFGSFGNIYAATYRTPQFCCLGDVNDSGAVNVDDLLAVINNWALFCLACPPDVNGSTLVNVDDLLAVVNHWGPCPSP